MPAPRARRRAAARRVAVALHRRPAQVRDQVPAGRDHRDASRTPGLYFKVPLLQNVKFYDKRDPDCSTIPSPIAITTSEKKPLLVDFIVLWRIIDVQAVLRQRAGRRGGRAAPAVADGAREPRRGVQQAHDARGDLDRARQDHDDDAAEGRRRREDDRRRGRRRAPAPRRAAARRDRPGLRADGIGAPARGQRAALARRRRNRKRSAPTPTASAR